MPWTFRPFLRATFSLKQRRFLEIAGDFQAFTLYWTHTAIHLVVPHWAKISFPFPFFGLDRRKEIEKFRRNTLESSQIGGDCEQTRSPTLATIAFLSWSLASCQRQREWRVLTVYSGIFQLQARGWKSNRTFEVKKGQKTLVWRLDRFWVACHESPAKPRPSLMLLSCENKCWSLKTTDILDFCSVPSRKQRWVRKEILTEEVSANDKLLRFHDCHQACSFSNLISDSPTLVAISHSHDVF